MEPKKFNVSYVRADDWQCIYLNGKAVIQGHSIRLNEVFEYITGSQIVSFEQFWVNDNGGDLGIWGNRFPELLTMIPKHMREY